MEWEAAIVNTLSPGDHVLMVETGHFAALWRDLAQKFGLVVDYLPGDWRHGIDAEAVAVKLSDDRDRSIKAVMCVHNETSTGVTSGIAAVRRAMDAEKHPALAAKLFTIRGRSRSKARKMLSSPAR
jgi:alanine-glyoxylate transaminase / serine-glyoxylate transaminase / serine-pyruvate transaminase